MSASMIMARQQCVAASDQENIFSTPNLVWLRAIARILAGIRLTSPQAVDIQEFYLLPQRQCMPSLSRSGVFRARTRTRSWRDRDVQQPQNFVWSPTRPTNRLCLRRRNPIRVSSIWSGCWRDRPHGTLFKPRLTTGSETASRSKEAAS